MDILNLIRIYCVIYFVDESAMTNCIYDVILDCTDNVATRYLLSDSCVLAGKPLVSGGALRLDGQVCPYYFIFVLIIVYMYKYKKI